MHSSALESFKKFISIYLKFIENPNIVEIGSFVKNDHNELKSSILRSAVDTKFKYTGLDIVNGPNVDLLLKDPYKISLPDNSVDVVVSIRSTQTTNRRGRNGTVPLILIAYDSRVDTFNKVKNMFGHVFLVFPAA